jgi:hypothetical protein
MCLLVKLIMVTIYLRGVSRGHLHPPKPVAKAGISWQTMRLYQMARKREGGCSVHIRAVPVWHARETRETKAGLTSRVSSRIGGVQCLSGLPWGEKGQTGGHLYIAQGVHKTLLI